MSSAPFKLSVLPLRPSTLSLLNRRGFNSSKDVIASKASGGISNFAAELDIPLVEASGIYREVQAAVKSLSSITASSSRSQPTQTAASILSAQYNQSGLKTRPIISFAQSIDSLLGGGFQPKEVTEIVGSPGVGKSQLAMQLCVDARLPKQFGGVEGDSIYIDSEGSFSPERCWDMAHALCSHIQGSVQRSNGTKQLPEIFSEDTILDSIHVFRVYDETAQSATIQSIPDYIKKIENNGRIIKLVVIDSIAFHYRVSNLHYQPAFQRNIKFQSTHHNLPQLFVTVDQKCSSSDYKSRTKSLARTASFLADIASKNIAVVVVNQMTTKVSGSSASSETKFSADFSTSLIPALGESWAHAVTTRLLLSADTSTSESISNRSVRHQRRICTLVKSPHKPSGTASFSITEFGVRGGIPSS